MAEGVVCSTFSDCEVPEFPVHTAWFFRFHTHGDKVALIDVTTDRHVTYRELLGSSRRVGSGLARLGVRKGDLVALFSANSAEMVVMFYGALYSGATVTTMNHTYTKYEVAHQLKDCGAKYIYTEAELLTTVRAATADMENITVICNAPGQEDIIQFSRLETDEGTLQEELDKQTFNVHEDVAFVPYSSGTTGLPKGVMLTHYNILANLSQFGHQELGDAEEREKAKGTQERCMLVVPLYHVYGMLLNLGMTAAGHILVILHKFRPDAFLGAIQKYKVTNLPLVPALVHFLAKSPLVAEYDLSSVVEANCGAAPLGQQVAQQLRTRLNLTRTLIGYGMTETTTGVCANSAQRPVKPGSVGLLLSRTQAKVADVESGKTLGAGQRGELRVKGPQVMKGYINNPQATRESKDEQGFLKTGDIAYYDEDGYFYIVDRLKELIKVKGLQVAPAELEGLLVGHPDVEDAAVVGVPDERAGELPRAFIVTRQGTDVTEEQLHAYVNEHVAAFKRLAGGIRFIAEIPRLPSGKILRRQLQARSDTP